MKTFTTTKPINDKNYWIDVLKAIAIFCVIFHHTVGQVTSGESFGGPFWAYQGVPIFLIVSGYLWSKSYTKHFSHFYEAYYPIYILKKLVRFFFPYLILFVCEIIISFSINDGHNHNWLVLFFSGGLAGFGHYYYAILAQLLIFVPILYWLIKKFNWKAMCGIYLFNILFEVFRWGINMSIYLYEYFIFRWIIIVAYGVWLSFNDTKKQNIPLSIVTFVIGFSCLIWFYYTPYHCVFFYDENWKHTNFLSILYIMPIVGLSIRKCHIKQKWPGFLGRASYSFFISQAIVMTFRSVFSFTNNQSLNVFVWWVLIFAIGTCLYYLVDILICNNTVKLINNLQTKYKQKRRTT